MTQREIMRNVALMATDSKYLVAYLDIWSRSQKEDADKMLKEAQKSLVDLRNVVNALCSALCPPESFEVVHEVA